MMTPKTNITAAALAAAALFCSNTTFAASAQGTSAFQFLQLGVGARPSAMGETYAAVAGDANAVYWNPAGLASMERGELSLTHALWLEDITYSNVVYARPALGGAVGAAFNILNTGSIQEADSTGLRLDSKFSMVDTMGLLSYARGWGSLALGANLKYISSRIETENAHAYAVDLGAIYSGCRLWDRKLNLGLSVQDLGTKAKYVSESYSLASIVRAGASLELYKGLLLASDLNYVEKQLYIHAGAEYARPFGAVVLALRAGYKNDTVKELGALSGLTAGFGVKLHDYQLDYAWNSFTDLGVTSRISVGMKFGGPEVKEKPQAAPVAAVAGVPADTDKDGVPDPLDKCPDTSTGTAVDADGCPVDTDKDGVPDDLDKCPGTSTGTMVDASGCPPVPAAEAQASGRLLELAAPGSVTPEITDAVRDAAGDPACPWEQVDKLCMKLAMEFDFDKAELKGDFAGQLKGIAAFMKANAGAQIELRGCTDDHGADDYNIKLSQDRAQAVRKHLVEVEGLDAARLSASGLGKARPVADNQSEEGRQRNRRVIAILTITK